MVSMSMKVLPNLAVTRNHEDWTNWIWKGGGLELKIGDAADDGEEDKGKGGIEEPAAKATTGDPPSMVTGGIPRVPKGQGATASTMTRVSRLLPTAPWGPDSLVASEALVSCRHSTWQLSDFRSTCFATSLSTILSQRSKNLTRSDSLHYFD